MFYKFITVAALTLGIFMPPALASSNLENVIVCQDPESLFLEPVLTLRYHNTAASGGIVKGSGSYFLVREGTLTAGQLRTSSNLFFEGTFFAELTSEGEDIGSLNIHGLTSGRLDILFQLASPRLTVPLRCQFGILP